MGCAFAMSKTNYKEVRPVTPNKMVGPFTLHDLHIVAATAVSQICQGSMAPPPAVVYQSFGGFTYESLRLLKGIQNMAVGWETTNVRFLSRRGDARVLFPMTKEERAIREAAGIDEASAVEHLHQAVRGLLWSRDYLHSEVPTDAHKVVPIMDQWKTVLGLAMLLHEEFPEAGIFVCFCGGRQQRHALYMQKSFSKLTPETAADYTKRWKAVLRREDEVRQIVTQPIPAV